MIRTQIQLPEPLYREVQRVALEQDWSIAEVIRRGAEAVARTYPQLKGPALTLALEGHATEIRVTLRKDGSMSVGDNGRGMPVDLHHKEKLQGVELILTRLHSGAKFNSDNYKFSGGLHGVGISVVNALSESFEVYIKRDGKLHHMAFKD